MFPQVNRYLVMSTTGIVEAFVCNLIYLFVSLSHYRPVSFWVTFPDENVLIFCGAEYKMEGKGAGETGRNWKIRTNKFVVNKFNFHHISVKFNHSLRSTWMSPVKLWLMNLFPKSGDKNAGTSVVADSMRLQRRCCMTSALLRQLGPNVSRAKKYTLVNEILVIL